MSNFIEIKSGVCISSDSIQVIEAVSSFTCRVYTSIGSYEADIPYSALLQMLKSNTTTNEKTMEKLDNYLSTATITTL
jgi:hypothetical protein